MPTKARQAELEVVAEAVVNALVAKDLITLRAPGPQVRQRIAAVLQADFRAEAELEREAERFAAAHAREMAGMDRRKVVALIKERLARQRGIVL